MVALFISGPIQIAVPLLANELGHGAAAFGAMLGAHGAGTLIGLLFIPMGQRCCCWLAPSADSSR